MDLNIIGDPGTGNTFQEIHINNVETYAPNATTIVNNHYGDKKRGIPASEVQHSDTDIRLRQTEILQYVMRLKPYVAKEWQGRYESTWRAILALPEVAPSVYEPGRQRDTTFNRNLVANIIYIMCHVGVITEKNASTLTQALEGDKDHSVRAQLGRYPDNKEQRTQIESLLDS